MRLVKCGCSFFFSLAEEDDKLNDETFGDTGPLSNNFFFFSLSMNLRTHHYPADEWEGAHEKLAVVIEHAKPVVPKKEEGFFGFDTNLPKREKPEKLAPYNDEDNEAFDNCMSLLNQCEYYLLSHPKPSAIVDDVLADDRNAPTPPPFQGLRKTVINCCLYLIMKLLCQVSNMGTDIRSTIPISK